jgi:hypothetical protein
MCGIVGRRMERKEGGKTERKGEKAEKSGTCLII